MREMAWMDDVQAPDPEEMREAYIEPMFKLPGFTDMYRLLLKDYEELGFSSSLTDQERIEEFTYVTQQLRKYVFKKQDEVARLGCDFRAIREYAEKLMASANEFPTSRKDMAYRVKRDEWITQLHAMASSCEATMTEEEDDGR